MGAKRKWTNERKKSVIFFFFAAAILDHFGSKMFKSETTSFKFFPQRIPNLNFFWTSSLGRGGKKALKRNLKSKQNNRQTDKQTNRPADKHFESQKAWARCFKNYFNLKKVIVAYYTIMKNFVNLEAIHNKWVTMKPKLFNQNQYICNYFWASSHFTPNPNLKFIVKKYNSWLTNGRISLSLGNYRFKISKDFSLLIWFSFTCLNN